MLKIKNILTVFILVTFSGLMQAASGEPQKEPFDSSIILASASLGGAIAQYNFYNVRTRMPTMSTDRSKACSLAKITLGQQCGGGTVVDADCDCDFNGSHWMCSASGECEEDEY